ncbi:MAG: glycoside hydrolase family 2 TIM barrel-domain containing protein [Candidatus Lokiarchaeota archaeon]
MENISLNGVWKGKPDFKNIGIENQWFRPDSFDKSDINLLDIKIPGSFNLLDGIEVFEGIFWHFFEFEIVGIENDNKDFFLNFKAANFNTKVWMNGKFIGEHNGGFTPFRFIINDYINPKKNFLAVRSDNQRKKDRLPALVFDWFNWGGIYRNVDLQIMDKNRISNIKIKTKSISLKECSVEISIMVKGVVSINWEIFESNDLDILYRGNLTDISGVINFEVTLKNYKLWSPETPNLYCFKITKLNQDSHDSSIYKENFGIREIEIKGNYIYLNKRVIRLKGVSLHEELMPYGRTIPFKERENDLKRMKSLGFNALRTSHYSHDEALLSIADKLGLLILEEIPVYFLCDFKNPKTFRLAAKMVKSLIERDFNHPSVIWWSVGNEIPIERPRAARFIKNLMKWVKRFDDSRIVTYVSMKLFSDLTRRYADVATINFYFGWYVGSPRLISLMLDVMRTSAFHKPWIYTEFGAGAKYGYHDIWKNQTKFSEERQLYVLDHSIKTFNSKSYLAGWFIWIYRDFRSLTRQNKYQEGYNRKGIVSEKNETKLIYHQLPKILNQKRELVNRNMESKGI